MYTPVKASTFFEVMGDVYVPKRWYLGNPVDTEGNILYRWFFSVGIPLDVNEPIIIPVTQPGQPLDYTECGVAYPVLHLRVVDILNRLGVKDVQYFPVTVEGHPPDYVIMNVTRLIPCVDEARCSRLVRWTEADGFPDKVGDFKVVEGLRIDPTKVGDARIFRPKGWPMLIIASDIKDAFDREKVTGPKYFEV